MSGSSFICEPCQANLRIAARLSASLAQPGIRDGIFIADLGPQDGPWSTSSCNFCQLLYSLRLDNRTIEMYRGLDKEEITLSAALKAPGPEQVPTAPDPKTCSYELRVFSFLRVYDGINYEKIDPHCVFKDSITLAAVPGHFHGYLHRQALKSHMWINGHLICRMKAETRPSHFLASVVPRQFNPHGVLRWLNYCNEHHKRLCHSAVDVPNLKLIDCHDRVIILAPRHMRYAALSYCWGPPENVFLLSGSLPQDLPSVLPRAIEDAMQVTKELGLRYIWIDKYCIYQDSDKDKHDQIRQMDLIYQGSEITIVAAAGDDERTGLPGIGSTEKTIQPIYSLGDVTVISTMPHPHSAIKGSTWMTRGWTLQESILSRRRLVFTEDQIYFECNAMNCYESLSVPLDLVHTKTKDRFYSFMRSGLFNGRDEGTNDRVFGLPFGNFDDRIESWSYYMRKYLILATNFTSRRLSFDSDSLNAFAGIMRRLEAAKYPIKQLLGIPYLHPIVNPDRHIHLDCAVAALCWRHINCWKGGTHKIKRRTEFPSWTWAGWAGAVSWTDVFTGEQMDLSSLVDDFHCELEDGTIVTLPQHAAQSVYPQLPLPLAVRFSAWLVPPSMISLDSYHDSKKPPSWKIDSFQLELHMSEFEGCASDFLEFLRIGKLECIFVAKGWYNSYFLILEPGGKSPWDPRRRVGVAEAIWYYDGRCARRFATEARFLEAKKDIRLI